MQKLLLIVSLFFLLPASSAHAGIAQPPTTRGLVGYWSMEDCKLTKATDNSGQGNTGTLTNFALTGATSNWVVGKLGACALNFDGTDDYVTINDNDSLNLSTNFTVSGWFKRTTTGNAGKIYTSGTQANYWMVGIAGATNNFLCFTERNIADYCGAINVNPSIWHHATFVKNGDSGANVNIYLDGVFYTTASVGTVSTPSGNKRIGAWTESTAIAMNGSIDDVRIYNRALTGNEILAIYNAGGLKINTSTAQLQAGTSLTSGLVGHWTFDGKYLTATKARDTSGFANDGILTGANGKPVSRPGRLGQALAFDGVDDYVISSSLINTSPVTVSAWVKLTSYPAAKGLVTGFVNGIGGAAYDKDLYINTDGRLYFYVYDGAQRTTSAPTSPIPLNTWVHVMGTANGSAAKAYVNGVEVGSVAAGATYTSYTVPNLLIQGTSGLASIAGGYMAATIDDVRVYNRALTASEVTALYKLGR